MINEWIPVDELYDAFDCGICDAMYRFPYDKCPKCGTKMECVRGWHNEFIPREEFIKRLMKNE